MAIKTSDIKMYLTGISDNSANYDACCPQDNPNQSLGGFRSSTEINTATTLSSDIGLDDTVIGVDDVSQLPGASTINPAYAVIGNEIISYTARSSSLGPAMLLGVTRGVLGRNPQAHKSGDAITGATSQNLYDHVKASENESGDVEYRCFAVLNDSTSEMAFDVKVFLAPVAKSSFVTFALADTGSGAQLTDSTLIGEYDDGYFTGGTLNITGGDGFANNPLLDTYNIIGFSSASGTLTIDGNWSSGTPNGTTSYEAISTNSTPNVNTDVSFAVERHKYADLSGAGIAQDGGVNFVIDDQLPAIGFVSSGDLIGAYLLLLTGDGVDGVARRITAYNPGTGRVDVDGNFVNEGVSDGDNYTIVRASSSTLLANEGIAPPVGTGLISNWSSATSVDDALSININGVGENLIYGELFYIWLRRIVTPNDESFLNDNVIPNVYFEI
jgi:hypothetical protein